VWALNADAPGSKDPGQPSSGRAKKLAHWTDIIGWFFCCGVKI
jgi:hypothetical protein